MSDEDKSLDIPTMPIAELTKLTKYVAQVKKTLMTEGRDYIIQGNKQYTSRSGFAKLAQGFDLSDEVLKEEAITMGGDFYGYNYTIRVFNKLGRQSTGVGSCTIDEPNLVHHKDRPYHDVRSIAFTRAWNRAVSNFVGSADVSAEEMSLGPEFERKNVDSEQREGLPLPDSWEIPTWNFEEELGSRGWDHVDTAFGAWVGDAGLDSETTFSFEKEDQRAIVKTKAYLGENFGEVSRMLDKAGFKWRPKEKRWVLMRPKEAE